MELRQMQYFVTVCGLGNMSRAARQLFVSRQALSKSMAKLSEELGVPLFVPTARGVQPTEFARRILPRVKRILREEQEIVRDIHLCRDQSFSCWGYLTGSCNAHSVLPVRVLHDIGERYPGVTIQVSEHEDEELVWLIVQGELHAGYGVDLPQTSQLELTRIATEPLCALVNRNHPLAGCREVTMKALAGECILSCRNVSRDERLQKEIQGQVSSLRGEARFCD